MKLEGNICFGILSKFIVFCISEYIVYCGFKVYVFKEYFANDSLQSSIVPFHMDKGVQMEIHLQQTEPWKIILAETVDILPILADGWLEFASI